MKQLSILIALALLLAGCGKQQSVNVNNSSAVARTPDTTATGTPTPLATPTPTVTPAVETGERPVEFTYLGFIPDKGQIHYKIKVLTAKPISQVDLGVKYSDADGKVLDETTLIWQNIVTSKRLPIEQGKTYDVQDPTPEGTAKAEVVLKRVVFEDMTYWTAP